MYQSALSLPQLPCPTYPTPPQPRPPHFTLSRPTMQHLLCPLALPTPNLQYLYPSLPYFCTTSPLPRACSNTYPAPQHCLLHPLPQPCAVVVVPLTPCCAHPMEPQDIALVNPAAISHTHPTPLCQTLPWPKPHPDLHPPWPSPTLTQTPLWPRPTLTQTPLWPPCRPHPDPVKVPCNAHNGLVFHGWNPTAYRRHDCNCEKMLPVAAVIRN